MNTQQTDKLAGERTQLAPGAEYVNGLGEKVKIVGLARRDDGQRAYWSLQGNHYTPDGRLIWGKPLEATSLRNIKP